MSCGYYLHGQGIMRPSSELLICLRARLREDRPGLTVIPASAVQSEYSLEEWLQLETDQTLIVQYGNYNIYLRTQTSSQFFTESENVKLCNT